MEIVLQIETKNFQKVREILLKDELVSRASIVFKEAKAFEEGEVKEGEMEGGEKKGFYCHIAGSNEQCKKALELMKVKIEEGDEVVEVELANEVSGEEKEKIINKLREEENKAIEGFGSILG